MGEVGSRLTRAVVSRSASKRRAQQGTWSGNAVKAYLTLNSSKIFQKDYQCAHEVWCKFNCRTLWDYTILYLKQDVCILSDALENFITLFPLDPCHFVSSPGLSYDLCLYKTKIQLDLLIDQSIYEMFESGIRGGISSVMGKRYVKANNKYIN